MEILNDFKDIQKEFNQLVSDKRDRNVRVLLKVGGVFSVTFVTIFFVYTLQGIKLMNVPIQIIFMLGFIGLIISFLVVNYGKVNSVFYEYLLPHMVMKIASEKFEELKYFNQIKKDKILNKESGLFNRNATNTLKFRVKGRIKHIPFSIDQSYIYVSTGKSTTVYLNGIYLFFGITEPNSVQVRDKGKPALKGVKFIKSDSNSKVFISSSQSLNERYYSLYESIKKLIPTNRVFVSANQSGLHIALDKYLFEKPNYLSEELYKNLYLKTRILFDVVDLVKYELSDAF